MDSEVSSNRSSFSSYSAVSAPAPMIDHVTGNQTLVDVHGPESDGFDFKAALEEDLSEHKQIVNGRTLSVAFKNLTVKGAGISHRYQSTIFSVLNPLTAWNTLMQLRRPPPLNTILHDFEGAVKEGEMLLVLGRPGSGCSTLLKTIANQRDGYASVKGEVMYGHGLRPDEVKKRWRGDIVYNAEDDVHFPTLTVQDTLRVSSTARTPSRLTRPQASTRSELRNRIISTLSNVFGLNEVQRTVIGDAAIRGVSGGQKKRVSIAEALSTRPILGCWDNATRGLDASTALEFTQALRTATDICNLSTIVSIYQVPDRITTIFDKICLIYEGHMIYYGPTTQAMDYFINMGYEPKHRQPVADFLVSITDPRERTARPGFESSVPRSPSEFSRYYQSSEIGRANHQQVVEMIERGKNSHEAREAYKRNAVSEKARSAPKSSAYTIGIPAQIGALILRRLLILRNDKAQIVQLFNFILTSVLVGSMFLHLAPTTDAFFSRQGVMFFSILFGTMQNSAEIPAMYAQRPIVARHMRSALYHPFIDALSLTVVDIPITAISQAIFSLPIYWMTGLQKRAGNYFIYLLFVITINLTTKAFFRAVSASLAHEASAMTISGIFLLGFILYTGYIIPQPSMIGALRWITYINPLRYGFEALITNEFHDLEGRCTSLVPSGPGYENISSTNRACTVVGSVPGRTTVNGDRYAELSFGYSHAHLWRNFGIVIAFWIAFVIWFLYATQRAGTIPDKVSPPLLKPGAELPESSSPDEEKGHVESKAPSFRVADVSIKNEYIKSRSVFSWQHLNYDISVGDETRRLLTDVSGCVLPGRMIALMGESGAGKTTLLNVLAERVSTGIVTGDRLVNGSSLPLDFARRTGYCQQMDVHLQTSTVREALMFSATLRQDPSVSLEEKRSYVEEVIKMCELEDWADAIVGTPSQGLNIELRKRLTIGVELAAKPDLLLFLDEPTSGLDSQSAWNVVNFLKSLANRGQAILCTIHQPSSSIFQAFDKILLLQKGGRTCYFGDIGPDASTLIQYFEHNGGRPCRPEENPAEYILDVIGAGATAKSSIDWHGAWNSSAQRAAFETELQELHARKTEEHTDEALNVTEYAASTTTQFKALFRRSILDYLRNPTYIMSKLILNLSAGLFMGFTFFKAGNSQQGLQNKLFSIFMPLTIMSLSLSSQMQVPFINFRYLWKTREGASKMYHWVPLTTVSILVEIPFNIIGATGFLLSWYWTVGFPNTSDRVGFQWLMLCFLFPLYLTTFAQFAAAMSSNPMAAALAFTGFFSFGISFNGVMQPFSHLITFWHWMYYLSPFTWIIEAVFVDGVGGQAIVCSAKELATILPPAGSTCGDYLSRYIADAGGYLVDPNATESCQFCSMSAADTYLTSLNMSFSHRWRNVGFLVAYICFNVFLVYLFTYLFQVRRGFSWAWLKRSKKA